MYQQNINHASVPDDLHQHVMSIFEKALEKFYRDDAPKPLFHLPTDIADLTILHTVIERYTSFQTIMILGTGGSSLGGKCYAISRALGRKTPTMHFFDNIDPHTIDYYLDNLDPETTGVIVISKSGTTAETIMQFFVVLDWMKNAINHDHLGHHILVLSQPEKTTPNPMVAVALDHGLPVVNHHPQIGGRFAALSNVGMLPAMLCGFDPAACRKGASDVFHSVMKDGLKGYVAQGAMSIFSYYIRGYQTHVMMPYIDRLAPFAMWARQLIAESLGKDNKGITPLHALGTVDQHSQLQLFLDGPKDKFFTIITGDYRGTGRRVGPIGAVYPQLDYLHNRTMGDLMAAEQEATITTLVGHGCPTRIIHIDAFDAYTLGSLMMHTMIEVILLAYAMDIDPYSQPAVEEGKILTRDIMRNIK